MLASEQQKTRVLELADFAAEKRGRLQVTGPFLRLLHDRKVIDCRQKGGDYELNTLTHMQGLAFFASRFFGLPASYYCHLGTHGPHSLGLASDYYDIKNIKDHDAITGAEWPRMGEFLEFIKDRDYRWLEVASTLIFVKAEEGMDGDRLVEYVGTRQRCKETQEICDELKQRDMLDIGEL